MTSNTIWALLDDRAGNSTQTIGVANAFGVPYETKQIKYTSSAKLPNLLKGASLIGVDPESKKELSGPYPDIVIAAGRKLACVARYIKKQSPKTKLIHIMYPGCFNLGDFDIVAVPNHDKVMIERKNILRISTSPHKISKETLNEAKSTWKDRINNLPTPYTSVFVGGSTKSKEFTEQMATELGEILAEISNKHNGSILITTSRRTSKKCDEILKSLIPDPRYYFSWDDGGDNPYFGFMTNANNIIVTGDSIGMASESIAVGVPVYIYNPEGFMEGKHAKFIKSLYEKDLAKPISKKSELTINDSYTEGRSIINSANLIVEEFNKIIARD